MKGLRNNVAVLRPDFPAHKIIQSRPDEKATALAKALRLLLQQSLLKPRQDWDSACMLIAADPKVTLERYATAFFHGLEEHGTRRFQFFASQSVEMSVDEMWMIQLVRQMQAENTENARYLIALRVRHAGRRRLLFLAEGLAMGLTRSSRAPLSNP